MAVITNTFPYYDDFDSSDNYKRILFKPGVAVQARELTQLQSILQHQIETLGDYIIDDGIVIQGASFIENYKTRSIRISNTTPLTSAVLNKYVRGTTSNVVGKVLEFVDADSGAVGDPQTLIINWTGQGANNTPRLGIFNSNEVLYFYDSENAAACTTVTATAITANTAANLNYDITCTIPQYSKTVTLSSATTNINPGDHLNHSLINAAIPDNDLGLYVAKVESSTVLELNKPCPVEISTSDGAVSFIKENTQLPLYVHVSPGIFYKHGFFIEAPAANIIIDKYNQTPYKSAGINLEFINTGYEDDPALLDPAIGSTNYFAPGADRLKANVEYVVVNLDSNNLPNSGLYDNYIPVKNYVGEGTSIDSRQKIENPLSRELADRTYLESGNYNIQEISLQNNWNPDIGYVDFSTKGGVYVIGGNLVRVPAQIIRIRKGRDTKTETASQIGTRFGSYTLVEDFSVSQLNPSNVDVSANVEVHGDFTKTNRIGTAVLKSVELDSSRSSIAKKVYRLYFHNINMETNTFANARSFSANVSGTSVFRCNVNNQAFSNVTDGTILFDSADKKSYFGLLNRRIAGVDPNTLDFYYRTTIKNQAFTSGNAVINLSGNETWVGDVGPGSMPSSTLNTNYTMTVTTAGSSTVLGQFTLNPNRLRLNSATQLEIGVQDSGFNGTADILVTKRVRGSLGAVNYRTKTLTSATALLDFTRAGNVANTNVSLGKADIYKILFANTIPSNNTHGGIWTSGVVYYLGNVVGYNNAAYYCNVTTTVDSSFPTANFSPLGSDNLKAYVLDNGQRDSYYDHGSVANLSSKANVFFIFNYFTHTGTGPIIANTYLNAGLSYSSIPIHKTDAGNYVDLTDVIDFRPRREDVTTTHFDATYRNYRFNMQPAITPANINDYTLSTNYNYYVGRKDILVLDKAGRIFVKEGIPSLTAPLPVLQLNDTEEVVLGYAVVQPYTMNRNEIIINLVKRKRYTMKDIADLEARIGSLENLIINLINSTTNSRNNVITGDDGKTLYSVKSVVTEDFFKNGSFSNYIDVNRTKGTINLSKGSIGATAQLDNLTFNVVNSAAFTEVNYLSRLKNTGNVITMGYDRGWIKDVGMVQASYGVVYVNPFGIISSQGRIDITPKTSTNINLVLDSAYLTGGAMANATTAATLTHDLVNTSIQGTTESIVTVKNNYVGVSGNSIAYKNDLDTEVRNIYDNQNNSYFIEYDSQINRA